MILCNEGLGVVETCIIGSEMIGPILTKTRGYYDMGWSLGDCFKVVLSGDAMLSERWG